MAVQLLCERTSWGLGLGWQTIWRLLRACLLPQFLRSFALVSFGGAEVIFKLRASVECCVHIAVVQNFDDIAPTESALFAKGLVQGFVRPEANHVNELGQTLG